MILELTGVDHCHMPLTVPAVFLLIDCLALCFSKIDFVELATVIDPLEPSPDYGINLYIECLEFVKRKMSLY